MKNLLGIILFIAVGLGWGPVAVAQQAEQPKGA